MRFTQKTLVVVVGLLAVVVLLLGGSTIDYLGEGEQCVVV